MFKELLLRMFRRLRHDDITAYAAQITFYIVLSLFPFLLLLTNILSRLDFASFDLGSIFDMLRSSYVIPSAAIDVIESVFSEIKLVNNSLSLYIVVIIWSASRGVRAIMTGMQMCYRTRESRSLVVKFLLSFFYTISFAIMIVLFLVLVFFGDWFGQLLFSFLRLNRLYIWIWNLFRYLTPVLFMLVTYLLLYRMIPNKPLKFRNVFIGALFATVASFLVSQLFSFYVGRFANYSALYGSISGIIVIFLWLYFISNILMLGVELNAVLYEMDEKP